MVAHDVYGITPITSGLNNQRIALLGLIGIAYLEGAKVALPKELVDYTPLPSEKKLAENTAIPIGDVLDEAYLRRGLSSYGILSDEEPTEILSHDECFKQGNIFLPLIFEGGEDAKILASFLSHCRGSAELRDLAQQALALAGNQKPVMLQLRIERDWCDYLAKRQKRTDGGETTTDPRRIFGKISRTPELRDHSVVLACCDEDDLLQDQTDLKNDARDFGLTLIFKSDIEKHTSFPPSRLKRSAIDFEMCLMTERYVGLTRSSFSNMVCLLKSLETAPEHPEHYIYNAKGDCVVRRLDHGLRVEPNEALTGR